MTTDGQFDEAVSSWLKETAPARLPDRVLEATFQRTRRSRQRVGWRVLRDRSRLVSIAPVVGAAVVVTAMAAVLAIGSFGDGPVAGPDTPDPRSAFLGTWTRPANGDGGMQTMTVRAAPEGAVEIVVTNGAAAACSGTPSSMIGTGHVEDGTRLVVPVPDYACDDGRQAQPMGGPPLAEQLRGLTYLRDAEADTLTDSLGGVWTREDEAPTATPPVPGSMWPQASLEEVRQAQLLADAGDARYTWQLHVDAGQVGQNHPCPGASFGCWRPSGGGGEFFRRFLEERLGWEAFHWDEAFAHRAELVAGDVIFVRCATAGTNALYPNDPPDGCVPTIDDSRYETVRINVAQPDRQGGTGIWVVTGWEMLEPAEQVAPPSDAELTTLTEAFGQARIDGTGAEAYVDVEGNDELADERVDQGVPLLYATSTGAPFERSEFEVVEGPAWPEGQVEVRARLFAANDATVVEQRFTVKRVGTGDVRLVYDFRRVGPGGPIPPTTENGAAVPVTYGLLDGALTYHAAAPLAPRLDEPREPDRLAVDGVLPDDGATRQVLLFLVDPRPIGPGCVAGPAQADAAAVAGAIGSNPELEATTPATLTIGGLAALQVDVVRAPACGRILEHAPMLPNGSPWTRARVYLLDLPGEPARILGIVIAADDDSFDAVLGYAAPVVESITVRAR